MKRKNPIMAVFLNVLIPGLGCVYLRKWGHAVLFLIWTPIAWFGSSFISSFIPILFSQEYQLMVKFIFLFAIRARILYELIFTVYELTEEYNTKFDQGLESQLGSTISSTT